MTPPTENRIDTTFRRLRAAGQKAFIPYITAGDPHLEATEAIVLALEAAGADIVELGLPFSDPLADGPVNQAAAQRALDAGATTRLVLGLVARLRLRTQIPIVLYTYLNPLCQYGFTQFHHDAHQAGVDGLLILDLPPDEAAEMPNEFPRHPGLHWITLIAPTTTTERVARLAAAATGFIYYVSREGVTGERASLADSLPARLHLIRRHTALPVAVGFGISTPDHTTQITALPDADAAVVGSALVRHIHASSALPLPALAHAIETFARPLAQPTKQKIQPVS